MPLTKTVIGEIAIARLINFPNGDQWPLVIKLDSCGNKLWCRYYIDDEYSHGWFNDVILFDNGDVLALGKLFSLENYNERIFLYFINKDGNLEWRQSYASKDDHPLVLERTGGAIQKFGNQYIINGWCYYPNIGDTLPGYRRPFYIGIDSDFNEQWILPFVVNELIIGRSYDVIPLNDSVYIGAGVSIEGSELNSLFVYFNKEGDVLGYCQIPNEDLGQNFTKNTTGGIERINDSLFITSTAFELANEESYFGELIIDTAGNIYKMESRPNTEGISTLFKTFDDKYVIGCTYEYPNGNEDIYMYKINDSLEMDTVYPGNYTYDSLCPYQIESGIIDITDCLLITDVGEVPIPEEYFASLNSIPIKAYPNPVDGNQITLQYLNTEHHSNMELKCFNVFGKLVHTEKVYPHQGASRINVNNWRAGMYIALIYSNGKVVGQCKFIVQ